MTRADGGGILRHRAVRWLWSASACTAIAVWSVQIAVTVQVLKHHSVATLALVGLIGSLPSLVLLPVAGICADRFDVRRLALSAMALQAVCLGVLAATVGWTHGGLIPFTALYAAQGALAAFWPPTRQQWLYSVVAPHLRHRANSAIGSIAGLTTLLGAAGGGVLSAWNPAAAIAAAGGLQVLVCVQLLLVDPPARTSQVEAAAGTSRRATMLADLVAGIRAAKGFPLARSVIWIGIAWGLIGGGYNVMLAGHITKDLHGSAFALGLVYATDGLSVIVGTTLASRIARSRHLAVYSVAYVAQGAAWALIFVAGALPLAVAAVVAMRVASGYIIALDTTILLETVPARVRGRIASVHMTTYNAVARMSLAALGAVLTVFSVSAVGVAAGVASALFGTAWWRLSGRRAAQLYLTADAVADVDDRLTERA